MNDRIIGIDNSQSIIFANYSSFLRSIYNNSTRVDFKDSPHDGKSTALTTTEFTLR
jgi:hypothetical protein